MISNGDIVPDAFGSEQTSSSLEFHLLAGSKRAVALCSAKTRGLIVTIEEEEMCTSMKYAGLLMKYSVRFVQGSQSVKSALMYD